MTDLITVNTGGVLSVTNQSNLYSGGRITAGATRILVAIGAGAAGNPSLSSNTLYLHATSISSIPPSQGDR